MRAVELRQVKRGDAFKRKRRRQNHLYSRQLFPQITMGPGVLQLYGLGRYKPIHRAETFNPCVYRFRVLNRNRPRPVLAGWRLLADEIAKQKDKNHDK